MSTMSAPGNPHIAERAFARTPSTASKLAALGGVVVSILYLANIGAGLLFELPDALPIIGNLDEVFFSGLLIACLNHLGIPLLPNFRAASQSRSESRIEQPR
jgi:hypothetical protein